MTYLVSLKPIADPSQTDSSTPLSTSSIQREMMYLSTGFEHEGLFFDIKVNQIGKIMQNFLEKVYEMDDRKSGMSGIDPKSS